MLFDEFRTHRMSVERMADDGGRVSDGAGGWVVTPSALADVEGSLQPLYSFESKAADAERAEARWQFFTDPDADVQRDDVLTVTAIRRADADWAAVSSGRTFRVVSVGEWVDRIAGLDHMNVQLEEVQVGR